MKANPGADGSNSTFHGAVTVVRVRAPRTSGRHASPASRDERSATVRIIDLDDATEIAEAIDATQVPYVVLAGEEDSLGHVLENARALHADEGADLASCDVVVERPSANAFVFEPWPRPDGSDVRRELLIGTPMPLGSLVLRRELARRVAASSAMAAFRQPGAHRAALLEAVARGARAARGPEWATVGLGDGAGGWNPAGAKAEAARVRHAFELAGREAEGDLSLSDFERTILGQSWEPCSVAALAVTMDLIGPRVSLATGASLELNGYELAIVIRLLRHRQFLQHTNLDIIRRTLWYDFRWAREGMPALLQALDSLIARGVIAFDAAARPV